MKFCSSCGNANPEDESTCTRCGAGFVVGADTPKATLERGSLLGEGRYELGDHLGQGGMGSVFAAKDLRLDRKVAIKLLNPELLSHPTARARMEREARALARITHPNIVDIYDVFDHGRTLALVIEFVAGGALTDRIKSKKISWREALEFTVGVLEGLQELHDAELFHRDLKPDNILIDPKHDRPKIADLGVAHDAASRGMTQQGTRLGTPEYMSPEQIQGQAVDARTDLYAMGVVLYEMLLGVVPFVGASDFQIWEGHIHKAPDLESLPEDVPKSVRNLLETALAKAADDRYRSAADMANAARDALSGKDVPASTTPKPAPPQAAAPPRPPPPKTATPATQSAPQSAPKGPRPSSSQRVTGDAPEEDSPLTSAMEAGQRSPIRTAILVLAALGALIVVTVDSVRERAVCTFSAQACGELAAEYLVEAPKQNHREASFIYYKRARFLYFLSCDRGAGKARSCMMLGDLWRRGKGGPTNRPEARLNFERACDYDNGMITSARACLILGEMWRTGEGGPKNGERASTLFRHACNSGQSEACRRLVPEAATDR